MYRRSKQIASGMLAALSKNKHVSHTAQTLINGYLLANISRHCLTSGAAVQSDSHNLFPRSKTRFFCKLERGSTVDSLFPE
jgi:hypothetical protein